MSASAIEQGRSTDLAGVAAINAVAATAVSLVAKGKGILAADETVPTLTRRFEPPGVPSTEDGRLACREMLFAAPIPAAGAPHRRGWRDD
jgi:hypothetical protein